MEAVIVSTTMASVTELFGKLTVPPIYKLVEETLLAAVPLAVVKVRPPDKVPPVKSR